MFAFAPVCVCVCVCVCASLLLTYSQDEVVVGLVVDGIQDVEHLDGKV